MFARLTSRRRFVDLSEQEVLALAISAEEDDARIYRTYAEKLRKDYPASAAVFDGMAAEEDGHRRQLIALHEVRFGPVIPLIRREHVTGFYARSPVWLTENLSLERIRAEAQAREFYERAAARTPLGKAGCFGIRGFVFASPNTIRSRKDPQVFQTFLN
jgi:rubrerythrin